MTIIHNLGFPRIGARRELKFALESYWRGQSDRAALEAVGAQLRRQGHALGLGARHLLRGARRRVQVRREDPVRRAADPPRRGSLDRKSVV